MATLPTAPEEMRDWKTQPRDPDGEDGGQWVKAAGVGAAKDVLGLGKRITLYDGETFIASDSGKMQNGADEYGVPMALVNTPEGPVLLLGEETNGDATRWNPGVESAAQLEGSVQIRQFRDGLTAMIDHWDREEARAHELGRQFAAAGIADRERWTKRLLTADEWVKHGSSGYDVTYDPPLSGAEEQLNEEYGRYWDQNAAKGTLVGGVVDYTLRGTDVDEPGVDEKLFAGLVLGGGEGQAAGGPEFGSRRDVRTYQARLDNMLKLAEQLEGGGSMASPPARAVGLRAADHWMKQPRDPGGEGGGQWTAGAPDLDDGGSGWDDVRIFGHQSVGVGAPQHVVAFDDPAGVLLPGGGRGVAFRDDENLGDIKSPGDLHESAHFPLSDVDSVAGALDKASQTVRDRAAADGAEGGGPSVQWATQAGGYHIAAIHDPDSDLAEPGQAWVAMSYNAGGDAPWDDLPGNLDEEYTIFDPEDATDLAAALRDAATAQPKQKQGLSRKADKLRLDGRIDLEPGERLTASGKVPGGEYSEADILLAATDGPSGPRLRFAVGGADENGDIDGWEADHDGDTIILDAAGVAALKPAVDEMVAAALADRARYKKLSEEVLDPQTEALEERRQDILRQHGDMLSDLPLPPQAQAAADELDRQIAELDRNSPVLAQLDALFERRNTHQHLSPQWLAVQEEIDELARHPDVVESDRLANARNGIDWDHRRGPKRPPLPPDLQAEYDRLGEEIQQIWRDNPVDDMITRGVIRGVEGWGDLVWEVHGSDDLGEDYDNMDTAWSVRLAVAPPGVGPDWTIYRGRDDDVYASLQPSDLAKVIRGVQKVASTTTPQTGSPAPQRMAARGMDVTAWNAANPQHLKDAEGKWAGTGASLSAALKDLDVWDADDYVAEYGEEVYSETVGDLSPRFFESGKGHLALDLEGSHTQVWTELEDPDGMRALASDLDEAISVDFEEYDEDDADEDGLIHRITNLRHDLEISVYGDGDIRIGPRDGDYFDIESHEADSLAEALKSVADKWNEEFDFVEETVSRTATGRSRWTRDAGSRVKAAGLAVLAADTGRVLMLQRALEDDDSAAGMWEFPGGGLEDGEDPLTAAKREWSEETGCDLPPGKVIGQWHSGVYCGYVWQVAKEAGVPVFDGRDEVTNPDDPDGDQVEALAWWDPEQLTGSNPALRDELRQSVSKVAAALAGSTPSDWAREAAMLDRGFWTIDELRQRQAGVVDEHGNVHSPADGRFVSKSIADMPGRVKKALGRLDVDPQWLKTAGHLTLDVVGWIPGWGEPADLANAAWYLAEKDYPNAALSALAAVPVVGDAGKAVKGVKQVAKFAKAGRQIKQATKVISTRSAAGGSPPGLMFGIDPDDPDAGPKLVEHLRQHWGKDPRPWGELYRQLAERVGTQQADEMTRQMWVLVHGEAPTRAAAVLAVSIVDTLMGDSYTPQQRRARAEWLNRCSSGGYNLEWDADKELEPSTRAALLTVSIVDALTGGRYTVQQQRAREGWLRNVARFWKPGTGVPFKKNDNGQWVDRYGKFADLPNLLKPAKAVASKAAPAKKAAPRPRGDVSSAIGRLAALRQDPPPDAAQQSRQILAGLTGPQLKQVADHFGVQLYGRLLKDKRNNLEHAVVGASSDHKAIMGVDLRTTQPGPARPMTVKQAKRQTLLDAVHGHADLAEGEHGELYQKIREGVDSGKWAQVQGRWAALQAEKQLLKQSGTAIAQKDGEKADRLSKLAGRYAKLAQDIQISDSVTKTDNYTNPRSTHEPLRPNGAGTLAQVPAGGVLPDDESGAVLPETGAADRVAGRRPRRPAGTASADGPAVPGTDGPDDGRAVAGAAGGAGGDAATGGGGRDRRVDAPVFRPRGQEDLAPATERQRLAANLEALRTLRTVQGEDRPATHDEQVKLARWSGWGSLPGVFKEPPDRRYTDAQEELKGLLSPAEFAAARRTTRNAHYTDAGYVRAIWDAMRKLGFEGGQVLEPGSGSGTFMGLVPEGISANTHVTGVELDPITAAVSRALYPNQDVRTESFAESKVDDGSFDAAIGNVPFSDTKLFDPEYNPGRRHNMHNHFILKSLRMTRPGGLVSVITSRYTMDSLRPDAREDMAELGDLVGAVRLPSGAHERAAGTAVVTDLLVFRRREPGTPYAGLPFEQTRTVAVDGKDIAVNELFVDQDGNATDMVLGTLGAVHGMRGKDDLTVKGAKDAEPALREALDRLVAQAQAKGLTQTAGRSPRPEFATTGRARKPDGYLHAREDGTFTRLVGGVEQPHKVPSTQSEELRQLLRLRDTVMALVDTEASTVDDTDEMKRLREDLNEIYDSYIANPKWGPVSRFTETRAKGSGDDVEEERVTRKRPPQGGFRADPFSAVVRSLEIYDPVTGTARKSDIFHQRGIAPRTAKTAAENPADALAITMDQVGEVDLEYIADLLGEDDETAAREALGTLVYDEPGSGRIVPQAAYLSGNVRSKLDAARLAAAEDSKYDVNVEALARALPPDLTPAEIRAKMGAGWIEPKYVQQFLREILRDPTLTVRRKHGTNWEVASDRKRSTAATTEWGIRERGAVALAEDILSQRPIQILVDETPSQEKTEAAQAKAKEIADRFEAWAWEDPTRARELQDTYNRKFNSLVLRSYDGAELSLPGLSREGFYPYPHRYAAIARIINEPSVGLWHEVGAGKTTVMIIGGMEMRRLGLVQKPAYVVPNHMLDQFTSEFLERYPQARVLAIGSDDLKNDKDGSKRREIIARAATGDWDAVILTQGAFKRIPVSAETENDYLQAQVEPLRRSAARRRAAVEQEVRARPEAARMSEKEINELVFEVLGKDKTVKELEGQVEKAEERIAEHLGKMEADRDPGLTWEQTGIDYLFVDEAHTYKNLHTDSSIQGMGIPGSQIATDLHMKLHQLRSRYDRVATLATATPIANSVAEAYTMLRYVRPDLLEDMGIDTFDDFAANFGEVVSRLEVAPTGGLRQHSRFARFVNIPELLRAWLVASDVKTADDLKGIVKVPELAERVDADGRTTRTPEIDVTPPSEELKDLMASLVDRAMNIPYPPEKGGDNMLKITGEGRAAALDLAMVGRSTNEPQKLDRAADRIASIYADSKDRVYTDRDGNPTGTTGALQLVFSDIGTPNARKAKRAKGKAAEAAGGQPMLTEDQTGYFPEDVDLSNFNAYDALRDKLVARGIPRQKIRFIHEAKTDQEKAELFAAARDGRIAVLVGSTAKMGVGTNVQDRAVALHHLDAPWRPADVQQREGRIIRQGNKNPEVQLIRYVTEQSFDAYIWQAITTKGMFINQIMRGRADVREMDDVGDFALSAAEVTALGTGNRWLIEHADAKAELTRLQRALHNHEADQRNLARQITVGESEIAGSQQLITKLDQAIAKRVDTRGDSFRMRLGDTHYDSRPDAQERLRQLLKGVVRGLEKDSETIGEFAGFPLRATPTDNGVEVELVGVPASTITIGRSEIASGDIIGKLQTPLGNMEKFRARHIARVAEAQQDIESLRSRVGKPFRDTDALKAARDRFEHVDAQLKAELASRGQAQAPQDPAARQAAAIADIRSRLNAGEGFKGIGELTAWLEADPDLADEIPSDAGPKWGVLSPRGQLVVHKDPRGGYHISIPRTMKTSKAMADLRTQTAAKKLAEILENSGIPWNTGSDLAEWRAPDGATASEVVARLRGEHRELDKNGAWKEAADRAEVKRRMPERLREPLLEGQYRRDGLGAGPFLRLPREAREEILAILQGGNPDSDLATAARLREYGLADGVAYQAQQFAIAAAARLERDYRERVPQPLDSVRNQFEKDFDRLDYSVRERARIDQILAEADATGDLMTAAQRLRALASELQADRYGAYGRQTVIDVAGSLADVLIRRAELAQFDGWSDAELRALLGQQGLPTDGDRGVLLARLRAAGISVIAPTTPADIDTSTPQALIDFLGDPQLASRVQEAMRQNAPDSWPDSFMKERLVRRELARVLPDDFERLDELIDLLKGAESDVGRELVGARGVPESAARALLAAFVRHPGHGTQEVHGNWATKLLKGTRPVKTAAKERPRVKRAPIDWAARLASGETSSRELGDGTNRNSVELVEFADGTRAVVKTSRASYDIAVAEFDAEELSAMVLRDLDLDPPDIHRQSEDEAYFAYVQDTSPNAVLPLDPRSSGTNAMSTSDALRIGLGDVLIENEDRNPGNWFIETPGDPNTRLIPIDHGKAWESAYDPHESREADEAPWPSEFGFGKAFSTESTFSDPQGRTGEWIDNELSPVYVESLRQRLKSLRPEFERRGRRDWHDRMMTRLDIIASHAKGTVTL